MVTDSQKKGELSNSPNARKRGRPSVFNAQFMEGIRANFKDPVSHRTVVNTGFSYIGLNALKKYDGPEIKWLITGKPKPTVYSELGRILVAYGEDSMYMAARHICNLSPIPTLKNCVVILRNYRLNNGTRTGSEAVLLQELNFTINNFLYRYPGTKPSKISQALQICWNNHTYRPTVGQN